MKHDMPKVGHLPPRAAASLVPWQQVHVDLIGPWPLKYNKKKTIHLETQNYYSD
jgi:hypothetical protein